MLKIVVLTVAILTGLFMVGLGLTVWWLFPEDKTIATQEGWKTYKGEEFEFVFPASKISLRKLTIDDKSYGDYTLNFNEGSDENVATYLRVTENKSGKDISVFIPPNYQGKTTSFEGYSSAYIWRCADGMAVSGDQAHDCGLQPAPNGKTYIFSWSTAYNSKITRTEFDSIVKSFHFVE